MARRIRVSTAFLTALLVAGAVLVGPSAVASAAGPPWTPPTRLDHVAAIDVAVSGNAAAWLRPTKRTGTTLMWWSTTSGEPIATDARLRPNPTRLTLGTDAGGQPAAIVEYAKAAPRIYGLSLPAGAQPPGQLPAPIPVVPDPSGQVLPVATTPGLLDDGGYIGYVANRPFPGFDDHLTGSRLACPRGATNPRCLVWWRPSTGPAPAVPRAT